MHNHRFEVINDEHDEATIVSNGYTYAVHSFGASSRFYGGKRGQFLPEAQPVFFLWSNVVQQQHQVHRTVRSSGRAAGDHKRLQKQRVHDLRGGEACRELAEAKRRPTELQRQATTAHGDARGIREDSEEDERRDEDCDALRQDTKVLLEREER